jgi:hypothetical protein
LKETIKLLRVSDDKVVNAELTELSSKHLDDFETFWKPRLSSSNEEDRHWCWVNKYLKTATPNYERYALECDSITQGLMLLELDCHYSRIESDRGLVYIDFLSTAPWNRRSIQENVTYKGVGSALVTFAISRSFDLGYQGRVGLHALPKAEDFYEKIMEMFNLGCDTNKENLKYFELPASRASKIMTG